MKIKISVFYFIPSSHRYPFRKSGNPRCKRSFFANNRHQKNYLQNYYNLKNLNDALTLINLIYFPLISSNFNSETKK